MDDQAASFMLGEVSRLTVAAIFALAAIHAMRDWTVFAGIVERYRIAPRRLSVIAARTVPPLELAAAAALLVPSRAGAALGLCLMASFTAAIVLNIARGRVSIDCGCGGVSGQTLSRASHCAMPGSWPGWSSPGDADSGDDRGHFRDRSPLCVRRPHRVVLRSQSVDEKLPAIRCADFEEPFMTALAMSNVLLWITNIALVLTVLALARQIGMLNERVTPVGALTMDHGPKVGEGVAGVHTALARGRRSRPGAATGRSQLLFFLSPTCPVCKKLLPILRSLSQHERTTLDVVLASDGDFNEHTRFYQRERLMQFPYVLSTDLGMAFRISKLPYGVVVGPAGLISAKGLVNNREQIESHR